MHLAQVEFQSHSYPKKRRGGLPSLARRPKRGGVKNRRGAGLQVRTRCSAIRRARRAGGAIARARGARTGLAELVVLLHDQRDDAGHDQLAEHGAEGRGVVGIGIFRQYRLGGGIWHGGHSLGRITGKGHRRGSERGGATASAISGLRNSERVNMGSLSSSG